MKAALKLHKKGVTSNLFINMCHYRVKMCLERLMLKILIKINKFGRQGSENKVHDENGQKCFLKSRGMNL